MSIFHFGIEPLIYQIEANGVVGGGLGRNDLLKSHHICADFSSYSCWFSIIIFPWYHKLKNCLSTVLFKMSGGWAAHMGGSAAHIGALIGLFSTMLFQMSGGWVAHIGPDTNIAGQPLTSFPIFDPLGKNFFVESFQWDFSKALY